MNETTENGLKPSVEAAYFAGREAGRLRQSIHANPHVDNALFDPDQLSAAWLRGRKDALDARYSRRRVRAWNRA